jgi:hypothetical protein
VKPSSPCMCRGGRDARARLQALGGENSFESADRGYVEWLRARRILGVDRDFSVDEADGTGNLYLFHALRHLLGEVLRGFRVWRAVSTSGFLERQFAH